MIRYLLTLLFLVACGGLGLLIKNSPHTIEIGLSDVTISINFYAALILMLLLSYLVLKVLKFIVFLWRTPELFSRNSQRSRQRRAQQLLRSGLEEMVAGRYGLAEKALAKGAELSASLEQNAVIYYELASLCADRQNAPERRDNYLLAARRDSHYNGGSTLLHEAELALNSGDYGRAEKFLLKLLASEPANAKSNQLLDAAYRGQGKWLAAWKLLPQLQSSLSESAFGAQRQHYAREVLRSLGAGERFEELESFWNQLNGTLRTDSSLLLTYAESALQLGRVDVAEQALLTQIRATGDLTLIQAYSQLDGVNADQQLENMLAWEDKHRDDPIFLLAKAKVAYRAQHLALALETMERVIQMAPTPEAYLLWAQILESAGQGEAALHAYRRGLLPSDAPRATLLPPASP